MGIKHLYSFLLHDVEHGYISVNIRDSVDSFKRQNPGVTPTILIDLIAILDHVFVSKHETLLGGRFDIYNDRARYIFSKLKSLGANLVFFVDGPIPDRKLQTCLRRRDNSYIRGIEGLYAIDNGLDIGEIDYLPQLNVINVVTYFRYFFKIAQDYGEVHTSILNECDQDLVLLALKRNALAIISDDTDFLIFKGNWHYWSGNDLNINDLITKEYNKHALRSALSLSEKQMPLFATLCGNDIVPYEKVQEFHRRISIKFNCVGNKFLAIAKYVRSLNSFPPQLNDFDKKALENQVFYFRDREHGMETVQGSLDFYCLENIKYSNETDSLTRFLHDPQEFNYLNFVILTNRRCIIKFIYQDLRKNILTPYFKTVKPIFRRIMGVLLKNDKTTDHNRTFYFKLDHNKSYEPVNLWPDYPSSDVPPVLDLLSFPCGKNADFDEIRWNLLCYIISKNLNGNVLRKIPKENLALVLNLFYLVERKEITVDEADCFLIACNIPLEKQKYFDINKVRKINGRDARLAFFFTRFHLVIKDAISAVGLRDYDATLKFDGLYFHYLRIKWQSLHPEFKKKELELIMNLRIYAKDFGIL